MSYITQLHIKHVKFHHVVLCRLNAIRAGPAISAANGAGWPGNNTPVPGLTVCGDSCMPGIGVPAAAASGMMAANSLVGVFDHLGVLNDLAL